MRYSCKLCLPALATETGSEHRECHFFQTAHLVAPNLATTDLSHPQNRHLSCCRFCGGYVGCGGAAAAADEAAWTLLPGGSASRGAPAATPGVHMFRHARAGTFHGRFTRKCCLGLLKGLCSEVCSGTLTMAQSTSVQNFPNPFTAANIGNCSSLLSDRCQQQCKHSYSFLSSDYVIRRLATVVSLRWVVGNRRCWRSWWAFYLRPDRRLRTSWRLLLLWPPLPPPPLTAVQMGATSTRRCATPHCETGKGG